MALDTLKVARRLREAGFTAPQAEAVFAAVQEAAAGADLATKADLDALGVALKTENCRGPNRAEGGDRRAPSRAEGGGRRAP
jgi:hypothetical protein